MHKEEIKAYCKRFNPGDKVNICKAVAIEGTKKTQIIKIEGTVLQRYPHFLLIAKGNFKECYTYSDIALFGTIEKKRGRKKNESRKQKNNYTLY